MAMRYCAYKNCENFVNLKCRTNNDVKFFGFPKNTERRQKRMELGQVPENVPESLLYFCSDHFDKKFISGCHKRTVLVGEAVPFPYAEPESKDNIDEDPELNFLLYDLENDTTVQKNKYSEEQDIHVESTTITIGVEGNTDVNKQEFDHDFHSENPEELICLSEEEGVNPELATCSSDKRKLDIAIVQASSSKQKRFFAPSQERKLLQNNNVEASVKTFKQNENRKSVTQPEAIERFEEETNEEELINAQHVTTFIFKGEEYVQMTKKHYVNEKIKLIKRMQKMESALQAIRGHIHALDVD